MTYGKQTQSLACCCWEMARPRWGREAEPIDREVAPVHGPLTLFSLPELCASRGWLSDEVVEPGREVVLCDKLWETSADRFFGFLRDWGISKDDIDRRAAEFHGAVIGWASSPARREGMVVLCQDILLTLAVLSRTASSIFLPARPPDYSWQALFRTTLIVDEPLEEANHGRL